MLFKVMNILTKIFSHTPTLVIVTDKSFKLKCNWNYIIHRSIHANIYEKTQTTDNRDEDNFTFPFQFSTMPWRIMVNNEHTTFSKFPPFALNESDDVECILISYTLIFCYGIGVYCIRSLKSTHKCLNRSFIEIPLCCHLFC